MARRTSSIGGEWVSPVSGSVRPNYLCCPFFRFAFFRFLGMSKRRGRRSTPSQSLPAVVASRLSLPPRRCQGTCFRNRRALECQAGVVWVGNLASGREGVDMAKRYRAAAVGSTGKGNFGHGLDTAFKDLEGVDFVAVADD